MPSRYGVVRLNRWSSKAWGVIGDAGGLVPNESAELRMRKGEASALARKLNRASRTRVAPERGAYAAPAEARPRIHG